MKALVVFSGGMDSATVLADAATVGSYSYIEALSFDYGSKHNAREWEYAARFCDAIGISATRIALPFIGAHFASDLLKSGGEIPEGHYADPSMKKTVVPFRNGIMLAIATGFAESRGLDVVLLGNHFGDHAIYPDCRRSFFDAMAMAARNGTYSEVQLVSPFCTVDKAAIVRRGAALGVDYSQTYSCYKGGEIHCGKCGTCNERKEAFQLAGISDPTRYEE